MKQVRRDSNPQPAVLETAALPIELLTYFSAEKQDGSGIPGPKKTLFDPFKLVEDLGYSSGTHGSPPFTNSETDRFLHSNRGDQLNLNRDVISRHNHLNAIG
jgi:hypothetical protein